MKRLLVLLSATFGAFQLTVHSDAWARPIGYSVHAITPTGAKGRELAYYRSVREGIKTLTPTPDEV